MRGTRYLRLSSQAQTKLILGARDGDPVRGLTHGYYKYPARFSPAFARAAIETFTKPGDVVLDPHAGGGTALVEAFANGREAVGVDISSLAEFVARTKCTVFSEAELDTLEAWAARVARCIDLHRRSTPLGEYAELGYYKHLDHPSRWRLRKGIEQALASAIRLGTPRLESFARCVVLRTAQWALDGRSKLTHIDEFRTFLGDTAAEMVHGARELRQAVKANGRQPVTVLNRSAAGLEEDNRLDGSRTPRLVVTSPPYPGVHVLYHRWQVDGRKEAPLPFMIADKLDGAGSSYYTMGDRKYPELQTYFDNIRATMSSVDSPGPIPNGVVSDFMELISKIVVQGNRRQFLEYFKGHFASAAGTAHSTSSSESWALSDLEQLMDQAAANAPLFIEAFYNACEDLRIRRPDMGLPDTARLNRILAEHSAGYQIRPPNLIATKQHTPIAVPERPPSLDAQAHELIQVSLQASERLLEEGRNRQAVQEILWLLETVGTAFRGVSTEDGSVQGKYFNKIVSEIRTNNRGTSLEQILGWMMTLHGYLSSPTGGGIRHGLDLREGLAVQASEARLYCNLIRSYITFLITEHERLSRG